ncbi:MAG: imidazolonepropionase [Balneolaceae bacterium]|nr:imidazolonepropionase [Balneolaceae bacterium]
MSDLLIQNIGQIASPKPGNTRGKELGDLSIIEDGAVYIRDGVIKSVGTLSEVLDEVEGQPEVVDAGGRAAIPGFVDSHSHLVFGGNRAHEFAMRSAGATYEEIAAQGGGIVSTVEATRAMSKAELEARAFLRLELALEQGITTMEIKSGYGLDLDTERKMLEVINELNDHQPIELVPTFLGAHAVPTGSTKEEYLEEVLNMIPELSDLAEYCDVFCEKGYFTKEESRRVLEKGLKHGLKPKIHTNQFNDIGGVEMALDLEAVSVDHLEVLSDEDVRSISDSDTIATVLPGVSYFLNISYSPARKLIDEGAIVALASDFNPGSSMTMCMQLLMNMACTKMGMSVEEALSCSTQNGALALERKNIGCISEGYQADLLLLETDDFRNVAYFFGQNHVSVVIKKGKIAYKCTHLER